jgi:hypothetical protein
MYNLFCGKTLLRDEDDKNEDDPEVKEAKHEQAKKERAEKMAERKAERVERAERKAEKARRKAEGGRKGKKKALSSKLIIDSDGPLKKAPELMDIEEEDNRDINRDGATTNGDTTDVSGMLTDRTNELHTDYDADKSMVSSPTWTRCMSLPPSLIHLTHILLPASTPDPTTSAQQANANGDEKMAEAPSSPSPNTGASSGMVVNTVTNPIFQHLRHIQALGWDLQMFVLLPLLHKMLELNEDAAIGLVSAWHRRRLAPLMLTVVFTDSPEALKEKKCACLVPYGSSPVLQLSSPSPMGEEHHPPGDQQDEE